MDGDALTARILHLQRLSTEDGPGLRTTVFFKGCPLACCWCHNPESISPRPQVQWVETHCIGCGTCLEACPNGCLRLTSEGIVIDRACCVGCGTCAEACPTGALELLGRRVTVGDLVAEVLKDRTYFELSGGGVTISGGEPTLQPAFVAEFLRRLREAGVQTALDTCGVTSRRQLEGLLAYTDLVLFDLKEMDAERHRAFTGRSNEAILENLLFVGDYVPVPGGVSETGDVTGSGATERAAAVRLWVRTPLIPGATLTRENLVAIGAFLSDHLDGRVERWELCAFNNLCRDKYRRLGLAWDFATTPLLTQEELAEAEAWARSSGVSPEVVVATGRAEG